MVIKRRKKVDFFAYKKVTKPVRVKFQTSSGEQISFKAQKAFTKRVKVSFFAKRKKKR